MTPSVKPNRRLRSILFRCFRLKTSGKRGHARPARRGISKQNARHSFALLKVDLCFGSRRLEFLAQISYFEN